MKVKRSLLFAGATMMLLVSAHAQAQGTWRTFDIPGAIWTYAEGIDGPTISGHYYDGTKTHGFIFDLTTWTTVDIPVDFQEAMSTVFHRCDSRNVAGTYNRPGSQDHGFVYNYRDKSFQTISFPGAIETYPYGLDGASIVGMCIISGELQQHGFLYDGITWRTFDAAGAAST